MYAIIDDGQRQFKVEQGTRFEVELKDIEQGQQTYVFDRVLMIGGDDAADRRIGTPLVDGARVVASIVGEVKGVKLVIQKFRRRTTYRRKTGHRQKYLQLRVDAIEV